MNPPKRPPPNPAPHSRTAIRQITWVPEIGLVSASLDSTIKVYDFVRERVINTCTHHSKAVHGFVWCRCGPEGGS